MRWLVTGTWDFDGKNGSTKVEAATMREALDAAKREGLTGIEAIVAGDAAIAARPRGKQRMLALSVGEAWAIIGVGALLSPVLVGIPFIVWGILALRRHGER